MASFTVVGAKTRSQKFSRWGSTKIRGLGCFSEGQVPLAKQALEFVVEYPCSDLKQKVGPARGPAHRLLLDKPLADHLIDRGLNEAR